MLIHSSVGEHLGFFHLLPLVVNAAVNLLVHVLALGCSFIAHLFYYFVKFPLLLVLVGFPFLVISSVSMGFPLESQ